MIPQDIDPVILFFRFFRDEVAWNRDHEGTMVDRTSERYWLRLVLLHSGVQLLGLDQQSTIEPFSDDGHPDSGR